MNETKILITPPGTDFELLDSGDGEKLERYGRYVLRRPDPQAVWSKSQSEKKWQEADAVFFREEDETGWHKNSSMPEEWQISFGKLKFAIKPTAFKHTGVFPEQLPNWDWISNLIKTENRPIKVLNLFGYTGGATLAALSTGAEVCHIDSSRSSITWARQNAEISGLADRPARWIPEDARKFVAREITRGNHYDGIILDPPAFGRGTQGEVWKIETDLLPLLSQCKQILSEKPLFFLLNGYAAGYSAIGYNNALTSILSNLGGQFESGELTIEESISKRLLPCGIFARWKSN